MAIIISDTSPIRALHHLQLMPLLQTLYGQVIIPQTVADELTRAGKHFGPLDIQQFPFLTARTATDRARVTLLEQTLDPGEAEAIALAIELSADLILIDELEGRKTAQSLGLNLTGVLGILIEAKSKGLVPALRPLVDSLRIGLDFHLNPKFVEDTLKRVGE